MAKGFASVPRLLEVKEDQSFNHGCTFVGNVPTVWE